MGTNTLQRATEQLDLHLTVEGDVTDLAGAGARFRVVAPVGTDQDSGEAQLDPWTKASRWLWAGYMYEPPLVGYTGASGVERKAPGPDNDPATPDANLKGQYYCWNRTYDIGTGRWTTPDPAASPVTNLLSFAANRGVDRTDPSGLSSVINPGGNVQVPWARIGLSSLIDCTGCTRTLLGIQMINNYSGYNNTTHKDSTYNPTAMYTGVEVYADVSTPFHSEPFPPNNHCCCRSITWIQSVRSVGFPEQPSVSVVDPHPSDDGYPYYYNQNGWRSAPYFFYDGPRVRRHESVVRGADFVTCAVCTMREDPYDHSQGEVATDRILGCFSWGYRRGPGSPDGNVDTSKDQFKDVHFHTAPPPEWQLAVRRDFPWYQWKSCRGN
ncbi:MAG: hypothetical protein IPK87_10010 [Planctomycetes bacterium]|nr:hypothetical protein [Planctomycetota bacterium]